MNHLINHIKALEEQLLQADLKAHPEIIDALLSEDFEEIGHKGKFSSRAEVVSWLINKDKKIEWLLNEFRLRELTPELVLISYCENVKNTPNKDSKGSLRSSIWRKKDDHWQMIFHQATMRV